MSQDIVIVNREYKSSLFARIFSEPEAALSLYNSLNGTDYDDPAGLEINTIESVLYIGWKNDVSFLIGSDMNLYEHQATWNPNMPLRGLFYFADLYRGYVSSRSLDIYAGVPLKLPAPRYTVFYNGTREEPESLELRLSSLFMKKDGTQDARAEEASPAPSGRFLKKDEAQDTDAPPALECTAQVLNINFGHNRELMGRCRKLYEYSYFIDAVRRHLREGLTLGAAVDRAADECIAGDILREFLLKHRAEVANMVMPEFDAELHDRTTRKIGYNEGYDEGKAAGIAEGRTAGIAEGRTAGIAEGKAGTICSMLSDVKPLPEIWCRRIMAERDIDTLDTWVRIARHAESLEEFLTKAGLGT